MLEWYTHLSMIAILFTCLSTVTAIHNVPQEMRWKGIRPLNSTREDVIRLLGHSANSCECVYHFGDEIVSIVYSSGPCEKGMAGWNVSPNTVVSVIVTPRVRLAFNDLNIDETKYRQVKDPLVLGNVYYTNEEEGITISTYKGDVTRFEYGPKSAEGHLRCPALEPVAPVEDGPTTYPLGKLDMYGDISFKDEMSRLDILGSELQSKPETRAFIIVYAGRRARIAEAQRRAERAKAYLISQYGIDTRRIFAVDGGYRNDLTVEIWFGSRGVPAPTAFPTVRPSEVQIRN